MKTKHFLYALTWLLIMIVLSGDMFSYHETRRLIKNLFFAFNPEVSIRTVLKYHEFSRKTLHIINYAIFSWLILCAWVRSFDPIPKWTLKAAVGCVSLCLLYSFYEEWRQSLSPTRTSSFLDIALDMLGAVAIQLACWIAAVSRKRRGGENKFAG